MTVDTAIEILTVRKTCMECVMGNGSCEDCDHAFDMAIKSLEERKTGRWNEDGTCSVCGAYSSLNLNKVKYCPECGAKMEGAAE